MESTPRKWVIQPLSPRLEPSTDLRTMLSPIATDPLRLEQAWSYSTDSISISRVEPSVIFSPEKKEEDSRDVVVQAKQVTISEEGFGDASDDWLPSSPGSLSSGGSHCGFYSFVEDPTSPEAELNEVWMVSPERKVQLATLKEKNVFKLQTYSKGRKPESLFQESDDDSRYQVDDSGARAVDEWEEKQLRTEIIQSQAPKQNVVFKKQWSALESLDLSKSPNKKLADGFSLCYKPGSTRTTPLPEPGAIDDKQIDFSTAREQFLKMEKAGFGSPLHYPSSPQIQSKLHLQDTEVSSSTMKNDKNPLEHLSRSPTPSKQDEDEDEEPHTGRKVTVYCTDEMVTMRRSSAFDALDSGLGDQWVDTSGVYGSYDSLLSNENLASESRDAQSTSRYAETPIEREIRNAQEREESLRRSRGIATRGDVRGEMVEIKTNLLSQSTPPPSTPARYKEKNRVSFFLQRELDKENKREEDGMNEGDVKGPYVRGTFQELEDRKRIFELADKLETGEEEEKRMGDEMEKAPPSRFPEEEVELKDTVSLILQRPQSQVTVVDRATSASEKSNGSASWEGTDVVLTGRRVTCTSFSSSSSSSSSSAFSPIPTDSALLTSQLSGGKAFLPWRSHLDSSGLQPRRSCDAPDSIQREIEEDMKREQELQELRESRARSTTLESMGRDVTDTSQLQRSQRAVVEQEEHVYPEGPALPVEQTHKTLSNQYYSPSTLLSKFEKTNISSVSPSLRTSARLPLLSMVTAQPWASPRPSSSAQSWASPRPSSPAQLWASPRPSSPAQLWASPRPSSPAQPQMSPRPSSPAQSLTSPRPSSPAQSWSSPRPSSPAQSWSSPLPSSPVVPRPLSQGAETGDNPTQKGLTETLLDDFEERRIKLKREESSYAGIQPIDDVNNEVLEATRVIRRKNKHALRWEAGIFNAH